MPLPLRHIVLPLALFASLALGCSSTDSDPAAQDPDAAAPDGATPDAAFPDAALPDGTSPDTFTDDADTPADASPDQQPQADALEEATTEAGGPRLLATIETSKGTIVIELNPVASPITVENFQKYADASYFDGLLFHRVIPDFMIQGGGLEPGMKPRATLFPPIVNEASVSGLSNLRGTIAMARTNQPDSATSQFFINTADNDFLDATASDAGYAVFGKVVGGMDVVDAIELVPTKSVGMYDDVPVDDVLIQSLTVTQE